MHAFDSSASFTRTPPPATGHDVLGTVEAIFAEMELTTVPVEPSAAERATILRWENAILETPFRALLLVDPGIRSSKLHLAASDFSAAGRMAIPDDWHLQPTASELWEMVSEPAWSRRTLCGRSWSQSRGVDRRPCTSSARRRSGMPNSGANLGRSAMQNVAMSADATERLPSTDRASVGGEFCAGALRCQTIIVRGGIDECGLGHDRASVHAELGLVACEVGRSVIGFAEPAHDGLLFLKEQVVTHRQTLAPVVLHADADLAGRGENVVANHDIRCSCRIVVEHEVPAVDVRPLRMRLVESAVKQVAVSAGIAVFQPQSLKRDAAAVIVPRYFDMTSKAQTTAYKSALSEAGARLGLAFSQYVVETNQRPSSLTNLANATLLGGTNLGAINIGDYDVAYSLSGSTVTMVLSTPGTTDHVATGTTPWPQ